MILDEIKQIDNTVQTYFSDFSKYCTTQPSVFTMSLCFHTDIHKTVKKPLNIEDLRDLVSTSSNVPNMPYMSKYKSFKNCILLKANRSSIKVFTNGTVHMTGSKTVLDGYNIVDKIVKEVIDKPDCSIASYRIFMMNISLKIITDYLDLDVLYDRFKQNNTSCYYDKNKHAALKIKFSKMSILIFSSGSILIMGNKSTYDIKTMLEWLKENLIS